MGTTKFYVTFEAAGDRDDQIAAAVAAYVSEATEEPFDIGTDGAGYEHDYDRETGKTWLRLDLERRGMNTINAAFKAMPLEITGQRFVIPERFFTS